VTGPAKSFLNVVRSVTGRRWVPRLETDRIAEAISQRAGLNPVLGRVLAARGVLPETADAFLNPTLRDLMPAAAAMAGLDAGAARLAHAVMRVRRSASSAIMTWTA
jgi:single-stranded-DNA-specific exonuclease